jgi:serine/threonine protein kinase
MEERLEKFIRLGFDISLQTGPPRREVFRNGAGCVNRRQGKQIGRGASGMVYETFCATGKAGKAQPAFVTKTVRFDKNNTREMFHRELLLQGEAAKAGLAPKILDSWLTEKEGVIVMELVRGFRMIDVHLATLRRVGDNKREMGQAARELARRVSRALFKLHRLGIVHMDSHIENVFFNSRTGEVQFIDFGRAQMLTGKSDKDAVNLLKTDYIIAGWLPPNIEQKQFIGKLKEELNVGMNRDISDFMKKPYVFGGAK